MIGAATVPAAAATTTSTATQLTSPPSPHPRRTPQLFMLVWRRVTMELQQLLLSHSPLLAAKEHHVDRVGWCTPPRNHPLGLGWIMRMAETKPPRMLCAPQVLMAAFLEMVLARLFNRDGPGQRSETFARLLILWCGTAAEVGEVLHKIRSRAWSPAPTFDEIAPEPFRSGMRPDHAKVFLRLRAQKRGIYKHLSDDEAAAAKALLTELEAQAKR